MTAKFSKSMSIEKMQSTDQGTFNLEPLDEKRVESTLAKMLETYRAHKSGCFILAPSGAGKSHYVRNQLEPDWIDGDVLWTQAGAHPDRAWWLEGIDVMNEIDSRSDQVTKRAKEKGLWIMGASCNWLMPDAIVLLDWEQHKAFIKHREETRNDGGATSDRLDQVLGHREWMKTWSEKGVPIFSSIEEAVSKMKSLHT